MLANFLRLHYMKKESDGERGREQDLSHLRNLIFKVVLPALYFCADNHHTHELEMTTNKLISDQGIMLVFTHSLSLKATTFSQGFSQKNFMFLLLIRKNQNCV